MNTRAQSTIEFTFAAIATLFLIFGMVQVFHWAGMDMAQRRFVQDNSLTINVTEGDNGGDPSVQLNSSVDIVQPMAAVYHGRITDGNISQ